MYAGYYEPYWTQPDELEHFGVKGMKWGVRRYQNADGTLTEAGKKRLSNYKESETRRVTKRLAKATDRYDRAVYKRKSKGGSLPSKRENQNKAIKEIYEKELKMIKKMKYKDMQSDKAAVGKQWLKAGGGSVAMATALTAITGVPYMAVMFGPVTPTGISNAKTRNRLARYEKRNR